MAKFRKNVRFTTRLQNSLKKLKFWVIESKFPDRLSDTVKAHTRAKNIDKIPPERRKMRPNVEATVKQFTKGYNHVGKLNVRGRFKAELYAFTAGIGINLGRIYRNAA